MKMLVLVSERDYGTVLERDADAWTWGAVAPRAIPESFVDFNNEATARRHRRWNGIKLVGRIVS